MNAPLHNPAGTPLPAPAAVAHGPPMPWTYILECADGSYYVGSTWDLERRVAAHDEGLGAAYTRKRRPVRLVWAAEFERISDAFMFEKQVQGWGRQKRQALIEGRYHDLAGLASRSWAARRERAALRTEERSEGPPAVS